MAKAEAKKTASESEELRTQLIALLEGGQAHATFADAVADFPAELRGVVPKGLPYSAWQIVEHIRIAQRDILDFSAPPTGGYQPMEWPAAIGRRRLRREMRAGGSGRSRRSGQICRSLRRCW